MVETIPTVLIFDSGVGGLSVYKEIAALLPHINYIYMFDNAAYPYGELDQGTLVERVHQCIESVMSEYRIDMVVIACNTASTIVLPSLRSVLDIPVVGVVPAIKPASLLSNQAVGLIATPATVTRQYTHDLIQNFSSNKDVKLVGSTKLVDCAEAKLREMRVDLSIIEDEVRALVGKVDVAVLGCTHFPLIKEEIASVLGASVQLVDSGEAIARRVKSLLPNQDENFQDKKKHPIFATAETWKPESLNRTLSELGFKDVMLREIPHSLGR